jgi:release factor glutamine methyltransferase
VPTTTFGPVRVTYGDDVLEPRPWTLAQSVWAAALPPGPMLELGCGAGHIGLAAAALTGSPLLQVDTSAAATRTAAANASAAGLAGTVTQRHGDPGDVLEDDERFAVIVADPPYIPSDQVDRFPEDPTSAIDGGGEGVALVHHFLTVAAAHLAPGGAVVLQLGGSDQIDQVEGWLRTPDAPDLVVRERRVLGPDRALALLTAAPEAAGSPGGR